MDWRQPGICPKPPRESLLRCLSKNRGRWRAYAHLHSQFRAISKRAANDDRSGARPLSRLDTIATVKFLPKLELGEFEMRVNMAVGPRSIATLRKTWLNS